MKILIFTLEFPPFGGGAGVYSHDLAKGLAKTGHNVTVLTRNYSEMREEQKELDKSLSNIGVTILRKPWIPLIWIIPWHFFLNFFLCKYRYEFDFLLITNSTAHIVANSLPKRLLKNYGIVVHGTEIETYFGKRQWKNKQRYLSYGIRNSFNQASCLIAVSASTHHLIKESGLDSEKVKVVLHGIDTDIFYPTKNNNNLKSYRKRINIDTYSPVILSASRLVKDKGQDIVIRAIKKMLHLFPTLILLISGEGPDRDYFETLVKDEGLSNTVRFLGMVGREDLCKLYQISDIFVLTSRRDRRESFGLVYIEANACKKVVIAGRTGGVPEAVEDGVSGILVDPYSVDECASAMIKLLFDEKLRKEMEEKAYKRVMDSFTNVKMAERTLKAIINTKAHC